MIRTQVSVALPDQTWYYEVSTTHPETTLQLLAVVPGDETGFALTRITGPDVSNVRDDVRRHPQVTGVSTIQSREQQVTVYCETKEMALHDFLRKSELLIEFPVHIRDGEATIDVAVAHDEFSKFVVRLESTGLEYLGASDLNREVSGLSDRQLECVIAAINHGYYDTPRRCTLSELADHLGIAKSTCSETLHRAEETIVKSSLIGSPVVDRTYPE